MSEILSVEIIFRSGPSMKVFLNEIYDLMIDAVPIAEVDFSQIPAQPQKCKSISFKIKECENRKIWSFERKATMNYFDWIMNSQNVKTIRFNLQNYQKRTFMVPWETGPMNSNAYQSSSVISNGDLAIHIEEPD